MRYRLKPLRILLRLSFLTSLLNFGQPYVLQAAKREQAAAQRGSKALEEERTKFNKLIEEERRRGEPTPSTRVMPGYL